MGIGEMSFLKAVMAGGPVMIPIIICSVAAVGIVTAKFFYLAGIQTDVHKLKTEIFERVKNNQIKEVADLCSRNPSPIAKIFKAGVLKLGSSREEIRAAIEEASAFEIPKLEHRLPALATIAHVAPLLGLLGTVTGLAGVFYAIQVRSTSLNPVATGDLAAGIWEALITTIAGLIVAIPAYVSYNYLVNRINGYILDMERSAGELLNFLCRFSESRAVQAEPLND